MDHAFDAYIPQDRRQALARGAALPDRAEGAALFADISGFTSLTEALAKALGPQRGAEELTAQLNRVYGALIAAVDRFGGSVIGFSGDAITCWFDDRKIEYPGQLAKTSSAVRATACALAMQKTIQRFSNSVFRKIVLNMLSLLARGVVTHKDILEFGALNRYIP